MKVIRYSAPLAAPALVDLPAPDCPADGVVVAVRATGVCRSDWHAWQGHEQVPLPMVPGHEFAGEVARIGSRVSRWQIGDRVTAPFVQGCGSCEFCRAGSTQICPDQRQPGFTFDGSWAEQVAVHAADHNLVALPASMDWTTAAALGCRFATAHRAVTGHAPVRPGQWLAILGLGGVGLSALLVGRALGMRVLGVDPSPAARHRALDLGAKHALDPLGAVEEVRRITDGGAQLTIDAIGNASTVQHSIAMLRRGGHQVQVGLLFGADAATAIPWQRVVAEELSVHGSHGMAPADYPAMLELVASGAVDPAALVGRVISLEEAPAALTALDAAPAAGATVIAI